MASMEAALLVALLLLKPQVAVSVAADANRVEVHSYWFYNQIYLGGFFAGVLYLIVTRLTGFQRVRTKMPDAPRKEMAIAEIRRLLLGFMAPMLVLQFAATEQVFLPACVDVLQQPTSFDCYALPDVIADVSKAGEIFSPYFVANCSDAATNGSSVEGRLPLSRYACYSVVGQTLTNWLDAVGIAYGTMEVLATLFSWTLDLLEYMKSSRARIAVQVCLFMAGFTSTIMAFVDFFVLLSYVGNLADFVVWLDLSGMFIFLALYGQYWYVVCSTRRSIKRMVYPLTCIHRKQCALNLAQQ